MKISQMLRDVNDERKSGSEETADEVVEELSLDEPDVEATEKTNEEDQENNVDTETQSEIDELKALAGI